MASSMPWSSHVQTLFIFECISSSFFTVEYLLRIGTWPATRYRVLLTNFYTWTDLLAILPFWVDQLVMTYFPEIQRYAMFWQVLQLGRVLRLLKFTESSKQIRMASLALRKSRDGIFMLLFIFALSLSVFSSLMYYAESLQCSRNEKGELIYDAPAEIVGTKSAFQSIPEAMWWCIVTITTTGYGDVVPKTVSGKVVAGAAMLCAVMMFSFPITIFSQSLSDVYQEHRHRKSMLKQFHKSIEQSAVIGSPTVLEGTLRSASENLAQMQMSTLSHYHQMMDQCLDRTDRELDSLRTKIDDLHGLVKQIRKLAERQAIFSNRVEHVQRSHQSTKS